VFCMPNVCIRAKLDEWGVVTAIFVEFHHVSRKSQKSPGDIGEARQAICVLEPNYGFFL